MDTEGQRRSDNFEDRGRGAGGDRTAMALPIQALLGLVRILGIKGTLRLLGCWPRVTPP
jgi:hypothetical protein